jgi:hypothetical protein
MTVLLLSLTGGNSVVETNEDFDRKTVRLVTRDDRSFTVTLESLRTRFCTDDEGGPCYDYTTVYVQLDNCGVTAYPLSEITHFETTGKLEPNHCIRATQSAKLSTAKEVDRKVYVQDRFWSLVGKDAETGEGIVLPFSELVYFESLKK